MSTERRLARTCAYVRHCSPPHRELIVVEHIEGPYAHAVVATDSYEFYAGELDPEDTRIPPFLYAINGYSDFWTAKRWARHVAHREAL